MKQICTINAHVYIFIISKKGKDLETAEKAILLRGYGCIFNFIMQSSFIYFCTTLSQYIYKLNANNFL